jgi:hypothetical protein
MSPRSAATAMVRKRPPGWPVLPVRVIEIDDSGPIQRVKVEWPEEPSPALTLRHRMILTIVHRRYPKGIPLGVGIADLERLVEQKWSAECRRYDVNYPAPKRDAIKRALDRAVL